MARRISPAASRRGRTGPVVVVVISQLTGLLLLVAALPLVWGGGPSVDSLRWGLLAGLAGGVGVTLLYRGLAIGTMSIVAPVTALVAAALPVLAGLAAGERPSPAAAIGVGVAMVAIALVSSAAEAPVEGVAGESASRRVPARPGLLEALGSGTGFGLFFVLLARASDAAVWPLLASKAGSLSLLLVVALLTRAPLRSARGSVRLMVVAGALDVAANAAFLLAARASLLSIASVLTALYPSTTILCARVFLHERLTRVQRAGLAAAAAGVVLITLG